MSEFANMNEVIALIKDGEWELGYGDGSRGDGRFWVQQGGLCKGGKTKTVRTGTVRALEKRKLVEVVPKEPKQPFWLRRYRYVPATKPGAKGV